VFYRVTGLGEGLARDRRIAFIVKNLSLQNFMISDALSSREMGSCFKYIKCALLMNYIYVSIPQINIT
jgi:hypothetical protein